MRNFIENVSEAKYVFNYKMGVVRVAVEPNYKYLKQMWVIQEFLRHFKVQQAPITLLYKANDILWNF